jgi:hypothetical protein
MLRAIRETVPVSKHFALTFGTYGGIAQPAGGGFQGQNAELAAEVDRLIPLVSL